MRNTGIQVRLFNSHPHKEDDKTNQAILFYNCFSTHILTRRMTVHDDTSLGVLQFFNSHPHKEDDVNVMLLNAHSVFQLTSSQGG